MLGPPPSHAPLQRAHAQRRLQQLEALMADQDDHAQ
jgi:hypothetical protein